MYGMNRIQQNTHDYQGSLYYCLKIKNVTYPKYSSIRQTLGLIRNFYIKYISLIWKFKLILIESDLKLSFNADFTAVSTNEKYVFILYTKSISLY
jgi:hypothetical protein